MWHVVVSSLQKTPAALLLDALSIMGLGGQAVPSVLESLECYGQLNQDCGESVPLRCRICVRERCQALEISDVREELQSLYHEVDPEAFSLYTHMSSNRYLTTKTCCCQAMRTELPSRPW